MTGPAPEASLRFKGGSRSLTGFNMFLALRMMYTHAHAWNSEGRKEQRWKSDKVAFLIPHVWGNRSLWCNPQPPASCLQIVAPLSVLEAEDAVDCVSPAGRVEYLFIALFPWCSNDSKSSVAYVCHPGLYAPLLPQLERS